MASHRIEDLDSFSALESAPWARMNEAPFELIDSVFSDAMEEIVRRHKHDPEVMHCLADDLMCRVLSKLGCEDGVRVFEAQTMWCA